VFHATGRTWSVSARFPLRVGKAPFAHPNTHFGTPLSSYNQTRIRKSQQRTRPSSSKPCIDSDEYPANQTKQNTKTSVKVDTESWQKYEERYTIYRKRTLPLKQYTTSTQHIDWHKSYLHQRWNQTMTTNPLWTESKMIRNHNHIHLLNGDCRLCP